MRNGNWSICENLRGIFIATVFLFFICLSSAAKAQSADGLDPHTDSTVKAVVTQPDGSIRPGGLVDALVSDVAGTWILHLYTGTTTQDALVDGAAAPLDVTLPTDFFRSTNAGAAHWNDPASWESSHDGSTGWIPATLTPTSTANTITIRATHVCNVTAPVHADQIVIETSANGLVVVAGQTLTIDDGPGIDLIIDGVLSDLGLVANNGSMAVNGRLTLADGGSLSGNPPIYGGTSTLQYSGSNYTPGAEWSGSPGSGTPGSGQPFNVIISLDGTFTTPSSVRSVAGTFRDAVGAHTILNNDLYLYGDWTDLFNLPIVSNGHAVVFKGGNYQFLTYGRTVDFMTVDKIGGSIGFDFSVQINQQLTLVNGNVGGISPITILNTAPGAITGGSANSHITGPLRRTCLPASRPAVPIYSRSGRPARQITIR